MLVIASDLLLKDEVFLMDLGVGIFGVVSKEVSEWTWSIVGSTMFGYAMLELLMSY